MEEKYKLTTRDELKTYFKTGDYPTQSQFSELIDSYVHLNEFNLGLDVKALGTNMTKYYHFYVAKDISGSGRGHINLVGRGVKALIPIDSEDKEIPKSDEKLINVQNSEVHIPEINNYQHVLSRYVRYKCLNVKLSNELDIKKYQPKIIIKRYKQKKKLRSGHIKKAGFYQENPSHAKSWGRQSEYPVTANEMIIDINPINYFRPDANYKEFSPSGSFSRPGSFKYSSYRKPFSLIQMCLEIDVNGTKYRSHPVNIKIILGSQNEQDVINYIIN